MNIQVIRLLKNRLLRHLSRVTGLLGLVLFYGSVAAVALVEVNGNTISWPDDGWYQVENQLTGEIVCQGGRECEVPDGIYWVTQFVDGGGASWRVEVGEDVTPDVTNETFAATISIEDTVLQWTIPGWYQVQDAETSVEICNGLSVCDVLGGGRFIVINHTLGLRTTILSLIHI